MLIYSRLNDVNTDPEYKQGSKVSTRTGRTDQLQLVDPRDGRAKTDVLQKCKIQNKKLNSDICFR